MTALLRADVRWLDDRYHGEEWPPSPFKLQQALIRVAADQGMASLNDTLPVLNMFEGAPAIEHVPAFRGGPIRLSVPNNGGGATTRTRRPWLLNRMPQLPDVRYLFNVADDTEGLEKLLSLLHRVHTLGLGIDAAFIEAQVCDVTQPRYLPIRIEPIRTAVQSGGSDDLGYGPAAAQTVGRDFEHLLRLRVGVPGGIRQAVDELGVYFDRVESLWQEAARNRKPRGRDIKPQVSIARPPDVGFEKRPYHVVDADPSLQHANMMVAASRYQVVALSVDPISGVAPEASFTAKLAAMMRHACHQLIRPYAVQGAPWTRFIEGPVCGHGSDANLRIAFAPLPSWTGPRPDGRLRRGLVAIPETVCEQFPEQIRELIFRLRSGIEVFRESADQFLPASDRRFAFLAPAENDDSFDLCLDASKTWSSVTPVVLHGHDRRRSGRISRTKVERMLGNALRQVGLETLVAEYDVSQVCFSPGLPPASRFFRPENLNSPDRTIYHVKLTFKCAVSGPILLGLGRHRGLGLFIPAPDA